MTGIRPATDDDLPALARLRWRWVEELGGVTGTREEYEQHFVAWAREHAATHRAVLAETERDGALVGMAWLALAPRLPSPGQPNRVNAELQSVYVIPEARTHGTGAALIAAVLTLATDAERIIVHASEAGLEAYARAGFSPSPLLLEREP